MTKKNTKVGPSKYLEFLLDKCLKRLMIHKVVAVNFSVDWLIIPAIAATTNTDIKLLRGAHCLTRKSGIHSLLTDIIQETFLLLGLIWVTLQDFVKPKLY